MHVGVELFSPVEHLILRIPFVFDLENECDEVKVAKLCKTAGKTCMEKKCYKLVANKDFLRDL
jgi:hypothetical protein